MVTYLTLVQGVTSKLKGLSVTRIPRGENTRVDQLARLASSSESGLYGIRVKYLSDVIPSIYAYIINTIFPIMTWFDLDSLGQNR